MSGKTYRKFKTPFFVTLIIAGFLIAFSCNHEKCTNNNQLVSSEFDSIDATNDFYDNEELFELKQNSIEVVGEVANPGPVDFSLLPKRSVIVKETLLDGDGDEFVGAYRYDGYSLYDILNNYKLAKKNGEEFPPIIDLFVEIENDKGDKVVVSWGEIYYPNHLNEIIIATDVMRIVPSKTHDLWPLATDSKLVVANDLITERNISNPTKITVKSYVKDLDIVKGKNPLYSPTVDFYVENELIETISENPDTLQEKSLHTIFYGRGRGIHSTKPFVGVDLKEILLNTMVKRSQESLREGIVVVTADDGYRCVYTLSEIINRNDQADFLLVCSPEVTHKGIFRIFPSSDFFSDRAVKGVNGIYYSVDQK